MSLRENVSFILYVFIETIKIDNEKVIFRKKRNVVLEFFVHLYECSHNHGCNGCQVNNTIHHY